MASRGRVNRRQTAATTKAGRRRPRSARPTAGKETAARRPPLRTPLPARLAAPVLVLNLNYVPVNVCTVRRAIVLVAKGKAELLEERPDSARIRTFSSSLNAPSIIRLVYLVKRPFAPRRLSRREILLRDDYTCQYCGQRSSSLTLDHVVPRRLHGPHTWDNVVAACGPCNLDKAGRTPEEANMKLQRPPTAPQPNPYRILENRAIRDEWRQYIPWQSPARSRSPGARAAAAVAD